MEAGGCGWKRHTIVDYQDKNHTYIIYYSGLEIATTL
jgi:hypothetical protein